MKRIMLVSLLLLAPPVQAKKPSMLRELLRAHVTMLKDFGVGFVAAGLITACIIRTAGCGSLFVVRDGQLEQRLDKLEDEMEQLELEIERKTK